MTSWSCFGKRWTKLTATYQRYFRVNCLFAYIFTEELLIPGPPVLVPLNPVGCVFCPALSSKCWLQPYCSTATQLLALSAARLKTNFRCMHHMMASCYPCAETQHVPSCPRLTLFGCTSEAAPSRVVIGARAPPPRSRGRGWRAEAFWMAKRRAHQGVVAKDPWRPAEMLAPGRRMEAAEEVVRGTVWICDFVDGRVRNDVLYCARIVDCSVPQSFDAAQSYSFLPDRRNIIGGFN